MTIQRSVPGLVPRWPFGHGHSTAHPSDWHGYRRLPKGSVQVGWGDWGIWRSGHRV